MRYLALLAALLLCYHPTTQPASQSAPASCSQETFSVVTNRMTAEEEEFWRMIRDCLE